MHAVKRFAAVVCVLGLCVLSACGDEPSGPVGAQPPVEPSIHPLPPPTIAEVMVASEAPTGPQNFVQNPDGVVFPDRALTPGAVFDDVVAADICELYYTQGVRQPRFNDKIAAFASYGISIRDRDIYQVDHLIPVSLGGSNAEANLWPQPYDELAGADQKDLLERHLRGLVCSNKLDLRDAQRTIATDWWAAYQTYMSMPIDPGTAGPEPWKPYEPVEGEVSNGALCETEGEVGYTISKHIELTCTATSYGELRWQKRY
nr:HNH endonuclease [uncultured bacterium]